MIPDHEATGRFDAISQMSAEIATLNTEIEMLKHARDAARLRADRAESVVKQLEAQISHPAREAITIYTKIKLDTDRVKHDAALAKLFSDGWSFICDGTVLVADPVERYTTLMRVAPIEPATDQPPITAAATLNVAAAETVPTPAWPTGRTPADPAAFPPAHPSISNLWNALYAMDRFVEFVEHWPKLAEYAPRVHAIFVDAGCDMTDVVIMKSFRFGHNADEWTLKAIFPVSTQIQPGTRTRLVAAGFGTVIQKDGREFIFDLPQAWVSAKPRKTVKATAILVDPAPDSSGNHLMLTVDPKLDSDAEFQAELADALEAKAEEIRRTNPLVNYQPRSLSQMTGASNQS